jgi:inorganic phosphate transporter, PiT family
MLSAVLVLTILFLAYSNGANDNFKGVATLFGSGTSDYRRALAWATLTTFAGSMTAVFVGAELVKSFSGKGLVPDAIAIDPRFLGAVGLAAAATVIAATRFGFPISTTHAMIGALVGAGLVATKGDVSWTKLGGTFFLPLLVSPLLALVFALVLYPLFRFIRRALDVSEETAIVIAGRSDPLPVPLEAQALAELTPGSSFVFTEGMAAAFPSPRLVVGQEATLVRRYSGAVVGVNAQQTLDAFHYLSAGAVGFARGLNDAPKIVALLVAAKALDLRFGLALVSIAMAVGGVLGARRIAETMSKKITAMNAGQGFTANLVTSILVIGASRLGVPVSTTHVSCGALFGIGAVNGKARWKMIAQILAAWVTTLPVALVAAAIAYALLGAVR